MDVVAKPVNPIYVQVCHAPYPAKFWTNFRAFINGKQPVELTLDSAQNREAAGKFMREVIEIFHSPDRNLTDEQVEILMANNYFYAGVIYSDRPDELHKVYKNFRVTEEGERKPRKETLRKTLVEAIEYITRFCNEKLKDASDFPIKCEVKECACRIDLSKELPEETAPVVAQPTVPSKKPDEILYTCGTCEIDRRYLARRNGNA